MAGITFEVIQGPQLHRGGVNCGVSSTGNMRIFCLLLMESIGLGSLADTLACTDSHVDAADPCKVRMQDCIGNDRPPFWSYA